MSIIHLRKKKRNMRLSLTCGCPKENRKSSLIQAVSLLFMFSLLSFVCLPPPFHMCVSSLSIPQYLHSKKTASLANIHTIVQSKLLFVCVMHDLTSLPFPMPVCKMGVFTYVKALWSHYYFLSPPAGFSKRKNPECTQIRL